MTLELTLEPGAIAPDFSLPASGAETVTLSALRGKKAVIYFYPKDDTPGCTTEALDFSRLADAFAAADTVIVGISKDSPACHDRFRAKHGLNVILASDADGKTLEAYGAWGLKKNYGREYWGIARSTFLIDANGRIARRWRAVKVKGHAEAVLKAAEAL